MYDLASETKESLKDRQTSVNATNDRSLLEAYAIFLGWSKKKAASASGASLKRFIIRMLEHDITHLIITDVAKSAGLQREKND